MMMNRNHIHHVHMQVTALDFASEMLRDADRRQETLLPAARRRLATIRWIQGDALQLPFPDASFDAATMGYGLRNVADIPKALAELKRVLRPGATVAILDFNNSSNPFVDTFQVGGQQHFTCMIVACITACLGIILHCGISCRVGLWRTLWCQWLGHLVLEKSMNI
jgi:ubiquinone/menaquinone biosynthesis C-methylase UbiE